MQNLDRSTKYSYILETEQDRKIKVDNEEIIFQNGIFCSMPLNSDVQFKDCIAIPVSEDITDITFKAYSDKRCSINIFNQQGKLLKTFYLQANTLTDLSIK